ncbi:hypothetical protein D9M72_231560 [compost metagenome]
MCSECTPCLPVETKLVAWGRVSVAACSVSATVASQAGRSVAVITPMPCAAASASTASSAKHSFI